MVVFLHFSEHESAEIQIYRLREENSRLSVQLKATRQEVCVLKMRREEDNNHQNQQQSRLINGGGDQNGNNLHAKQQQIQKKENEQEDNDENKGEKNNMMQSTTKAEHDLKLTLSNLQIELKQAKEALIGKFLCFKF